MTLNQAVSRLSWRFSRKGSQTFTEADIQALNRILEYINTTQEKILSENLLFAKLYMAVYKRTIEHYNTSVMDPIPQKELHKFLDRPIEWHYQNFTDYLNIGVLEASAEMGLTVEEATTRKFNVKEVTENLNTQMSLCLTSYSKK